MEVDGLMVRLAKAADLALQNRENTEPLRAAYDDLAGEVVVYGCDVEGHPNNYTHTHADPLAKAREADRLLGDLAEQR